MSDPLEPLPDIPPALVAEVKAFVRIDHDLDNAAIADFIRSAANLCENFTGQMLIIRTARDMLPARGNWQQLKKLPVQAISLVERVAVDGAVTALPATAYAIDIDSDAMGWVRLHDAGTVSRVRVTYEAGLAQDWDDVPATLRQGVIRLAGYLYANRDGVDAGGPPSAVTALWRPYRRMRLA